MEERPPWEHPDDEPTSANEPTEGVRIIGAEEAAEALERGDVAPKRPEGAPRFGDRPETPQPDERPALRFPLVSGGEPAGPRPQPAPSPTGPDLPHWTEPPTGEVPRILPEQEPAGEDLDAWASFAAGPRWRDQPGDWEDSDLEDLRHDEETRVGALDERERPAPDDFFSFDELGRGGQERPAEPAPTPISTRTGPTTRARAGGRSATAAAPRPAPDRDVRTAVLTGVGLAALAAVCFLIGPAAVVALVGVAVVAASAELFDALRRGGYAPATLLGLVSATSLVAAAYWKGEVAYPLVLAFTAVFGMLWFLLGVSRAEPSANLGVTLLGVLWVGFLGSFGALLLTAPDRQGMAYLFGAILAAVAHDVGSLTVGRRLGRAPLAPTISPSKTWEGLAGGTLAAVAASVVILGIFPGVAPWDAGSAFALGLVVSVMAPLGDLCESMVKRDLGIKDMSGFLPGHGGLLDRFDAILFVLPTTYYLVRFLELGA